MTIKKSHLHIFLLVGMLVLAACSNVQPANQGQRTGNEKQLIGSEKVAKKEPITYTPEGQEVGLRILEPSSGSINGSKMLTVKGEVDPDKLERKEIKIELKKDGYSWSEVLPVVKGAFSYDVPLFFGKGNHELLIHVPDNEVQDLYHLGTTLTIDTDSDELDDIHYTSTYEERGIQIKTPTEINETADLTFRIMGSIDSNAEFAKETSHLFITMSKNGDVAEDIILVNDYAFDDEFYLRFGPGKYFITLSVPDIGKTKRDPFVYTQIAQFMVENVAEDQRDSLPSRGVQSDAPQIVTLANELMNDSMSDREKAKAVYEYSAKTISYDTTKLLLVSDRKWDDNALTTLQLKRGMCVDYTYLAIALLRAGGMEARHVRGQAGAEGNRGGHAWVEAKVDGEWLMMDPTWGAGFIGANGFVPDYLEDYFDPSEELQFKYYEREGVVY